MISVDLDAISSQAVKAVREVGSFVFGQKDSFGKIRYKDLKDPQTQIDIKAEEMLQNRLHRILPEAGFHLEEGESSLKDHLNWAIDPIDGTKLFSTLYPVFFVQIALLQDNNPILGVIYNPVSGQMFHAAQGKGAYLNGNLRQIRYDGPLNHSFVNLELSFVGDDLDKMKVLQEISKVAKRVMFVSTILAPYILTNTIQAYVRYLPTNPIYDLAPREIVLREAGCAFHQHTRNGKLLTVAAHPALVQEIENTLGIL